MAAKAVVCYGSSTSSTTLCPVLCPQQLNKRVFFAVNSRRCSININHKSLSFRPKASSRESLEATGIPTSVPVRVAHELHQAGHRYLDVRTPDEFSAGHAARAINIPYMYRVGSGNHFPLISMHFNHIYSRKGFESGHL
uniref:Rhodanese domain-containing protein n=1 Tax=Salix viminalis TaxID=40686 RepID=A0A6N2N6G8_SALVM